ncbi:hypothetical protein Acy02nite_35700 [Actinoplanes cyaneus]|uniref:Uncharacterized protein n=1 Tax=Actinoplanes cyaneus TaxID=52696 RepID=A0A919M7R2_9ACTN|nr:hypothetical protein Acy02nite_35700 [Actinoplanes cyaneus]
MAKGVRRTARGESGGAGKRRRGGRWEPAAAPWEREGQAVLQETDGQFQLPLACTVRPKALPLPFGLATSVCAFG